MDKTLTNKEDKEETLEQLLAKITNDKKLAFLEQYPRFQYLNATADAIGVAKSTVGLWGRSDGVFSSAYSLLKKEVTADLIASHEKNIDEVAFDHDTPAQSRIFGSLVKLRAYDPDRYREKTMTETKVSGNIRVIMSIPRPGDAPQITEVKQIEDKTT